jgi:putative redox protein
MKVQLRRINDAVHFEIKNEQGNTVEADGAPEIGGEGKGMRPMELLLASVASCSAIDVVEILKKQRQPLEDLMVDVKGTRPDDTTPSPFQSIALHFRLVGKLDKPKVARAIELAIEKYCSAVETLDPKVEITHSFEIISSQV